MPSYIRNINHEQTWCKRVLICAPAARRYVLLGDVAQIVASPILKLNFLQPVKAGQCPFIIEEKTKGK